VYRIDDNTAIVETVDFFSPIVDDPYVFGQISAANSISDIYAMGARPLFALNIAAFPSSKLPLSVLHEILRGGADKAKEAGFAVLGGHTIDDAEPKYGMVVTGVVDPRRLLRNVGAKPGDHLVLTKPLGTAIVANAAKRRSVPAESLQAAIASMSALNRDASAAALEVGVSACTDVTGFGLAGHLRGMLLASGVAARLDAKQFPVLPKIAELLAQGHFPGGSKRNRDFYAPHIELLGATETDLAVATDAQTSGGLLIAVAAAKVDPLLNLLRQRQTPAAVDIGEVTSGTPGRIVIERTP
jgi:selenide, water dikinase